MGHEFARRPVLVSAGVIGSGLLGGCLRLGSDARETLATTTTSVSETAEDGRSLAAQSWTIGSNASTRRTVYRRFESLFSTSGSLQTLSELEELVPTAKAQNAITTAREMRRESEVNFEQVLRIGSRTRVDSEQADTTEATAARETNSGLAERAKTVREAAKQYNREPTGAHRTALEEALTAERTALRSTPELTEWSQVIPRAYDQQSVQNGAAYLKQVAQANLESLEAYRTTIERHITWTTD